MTTVLPPTGSNQNELLKNPKEDEEDEEQEPTALEVNKAPKRLSRKTYIQKVEENRKKRDQDIAKKAKANPTIFNGSSLYPDFVTMEMLRESSRVGKTIQPQKIESTLQSYRDKKYLPTSAANFNVFQNQTDKLKKMQDQITYQTALQKQLSDKDSKWFKDRVDYGWEYDQKKLKWINDLAPKSQGVQAMNRKTLSNFSMSQKLMETKLKDPQIRQYAPPMLAETLRANKNLYGQGLGPISASSLPFYAGRYVDKATGRIRTMPSISSKYLNPTSYYQKLQYLQSRLLTKWNGYVRAQQQLGRFQQTTPSTYQSEQKDKLMAGLKPNQNFKRAFTLLARQITYFQSGLMSSPSTRLVLSKCTDQEIKDLYKIYEVFTPKKFKPTDDQIKSANSSSNAILKAAFDRYQTTVPTPTPKQLAKYARAFSLWINKGIGDSGRAIIRYFKSFIPTSIQPQKMNEFLTSYKDMETNLQQQVGKADVGDNGIKNFQFKSNPTLQDFATATKAYSLTKNAVSIPNVPKQQRKTLPTSIQRISQFY